MASPSSDFQLVTDAWLTEQCGRPVYQARWSTEDRPVGDPGSVGPAAWPPESLPAFAWGRVPATAVDRTRVLSARGFYTVDLNVTLQWAGTATGLQSPPPGVEIVDFAPEHAGPVLDVAATCFRYSRFHLDDLIPLATAHRIKRAWVNSHIVGRRGDGLLVGLFDGRPVGFLAGLSLSTDRGRVGVIDLIGVAADAQRQGVGRALVEAFIERRRAGCDHLRVGTQAANLPSLNLYEALGFRVLDTAFVLHAHAGAGPWPGQP